MYDEILIPTDGTAKMKRVSEQAVQLAELCEGRLHVLYVVDETAYSSIPSGTRERVQETLADDGSDATKAIAERAFERGVDVVRQIRWGDPAVAIIAYAVENNIDLITMGTHGKTGFERYLLGSVAEKVVRISPIPVLSVHVGNPEELFAELDELVGTGLEPS